MDFYGEDLDYIHLKFGDARKCYNFTKEFLETHPNFCEEYKKYWAGDEKCRFESALQIAQYVDMFDVPVRFYFNYTDTPADSIEQVYEYLLKEYGGIANEEDGSFRKDYNRGLDGEEQKFKTYKVVGE